MYWIHEKNGAFSVKSMYNCIYRSISTNQVDRVSKRLGVKWWRLKLPPRRLLLGWKIANQRAPYQGQFQKEEGRRLSQMIVVSFANLNQKLNLTFFFNYDESRALMFALLGTHSTELPNRSCMDIIILGIIFSESPDGFDLLLKYMILLDEI